MIRTTVAVTLCSWAPLLPTVDRRITFTTICWDEGSMKAESRERRAESRKSWLALRWYGWHAGLRSRALRQSLRSSRRAMTLIELLVVIIILTTIVAAAIPIMAPADEDRRLREASRSLNTFITSAQARAIATNRLFGIGLKRLSQDTGRPEDRGVCVQVYYVAQQPPFCGFDPNSVAMVAFDNTRTGGA